MKQESLLFGEELRRRRLTVGLTLTQLAELVHYSKGQISKVERGMKPPSRDLARLCDSALNADGALVSLIRPIAAKPKQVSLPSGALVTGDGDEGWLIHLSATGQSLIQPLTRRQVMAVGTLLVPGAFISKASVVDNGDSAELAAIFRSLFDQYRQLGQITDPRLLVPTLVAQTHTLRGLSRTADARASKELLVLESRYAEYIGWLVQETGDDLAALWWTRRAVDLANAGGDSGFAAYGHVRHALVTLYRGDAYKTTHLARHAQTANVSKRVRGLAALREAQGHALACSYDASMRALERASTLLSDQAGEAEQPLIGTRNLTEPTEMIKGWCLYDLGQPRAAAEAIGRQLATVPQRATRARLRYGTRLALAYATAGEIDQACQLTAELIDDAERVRSATVAKGLRALARTLGRHQNSPSVRDLAPRLGTMLQTAAL